MPFPLLTHRSHSVPEPGVVAWGEWLAVPCVPKLDSLDQHSVLIDSHDTTTCPCCSPFPFLPSLWHPFTPFFFSGRHSQSSKP